MANQVLANEVSAGAVPANEVLAPLPDVTLSEPDYRAFCAALEASARGRAFLAEYGRRNRHANTEVLLAALERLQTLVREQAATSEADRIRQELRALLAALYAAKPAIDASAAALKAAKLGAMIAFVQHRIESIVANTQSPLPPEVAALVMAQETSRETSQAAPPETAQERSYLFVVPASEQPELPIPSPEATAPAIALVAPVVQETPAPQPVENLPQPEAVSAPVIAIVEPPAPPPARPTAMTMPEVNLFEAKPPAPISPPPRQEELEVKVVADEQRDAVNATPQQQETAPPSTQTPLIPAQAGIQETGLAPDDVAPGSPPARGRAEVLAAPADDSETVDAIIETMIELPQTEFADSIEIAQIVAIEVAPPIEMIAPTIEIVAPPAEIALPADEPPKFRLIPAEAGIVGSKLDLEDFRTEAAPQFAIAAAPPVRGRADHLPADDPLALIMALSEAERIALFT